MGASYEIREFIALANLVSQRWTNMSKTFIHASLFWTYIDSDFITLTEHKIAKYDF